MFRTENPICPFQNRIKLNFGYGMMSGGPDNRLLFFFFLEFESYSAGFAIVSNFNRIILIFIVRLITVQILGIITVEYVLNCERTRRLYGFNIRFVVFFFFIAVRKQFITRSIVGVFSESISGLVGATRRFFFFFLL